MHLLRTATVNAAFLSFHVLSHNISVSVQHLETQPSEPATKPYTLLSFLRTAYIPPLATALNLTHTRHATLTPLIAAALAHPGTYPWRPLAALAPEKLVSDLLESTLGAVHLSTAGSLTACAALLHRFGVLPWLLSALDAAPGSCWHPKEELGVLAGARRVRYEAWAVLDEDGGETVLGAGRWRCEVVLLPPRGTEGEEVRFAAQGWNRVDAEVGAAEEAMRVLKEGATGWVDESGEMEVETGDAGAAVEEARARAYNELRLGRKRKLDDDEDDMHDHDDDDEQHGYDGNEEQRAHDTNES